MLLLKFLVLPIAFTYCYQRTRSQSNDEATIIFAGDISFDGPVKYFADVAGTCDYKKPFARIRNELKDADLRVVNLESPLVDTNSHPLKLFPSKNIHHRGNDKAAVGLKYGGFDLIQLANNHMADFGSKGVINTMKALDRIGISYIGVSDQSKRGAEQKPFIKVIKGVKIGMLAYCWNYEGCSALKCDGSHAPCDYLARFGPATYKKSTALKEISKLKRKVDVLVVLMHWGREKTVIPALSTREAARNMKLAGANAIIGTHPHVIQGHECIAKDTLVVYSLGNFIFPKAGSITGKFLAGKKLSDSDVKDYLKKTNEEFSLSQQAYIVKLKLGREKIVSAEYLPIEIRSEKGTNCLQPVPRGRWQKMCTPDDTYCYDFRDFYSNSSMEHEEQMLTFSEKKDICINN